ncbi:hypothetical protein KKA69_03965 [Patescibacteria group bacterium]|nr:hypothetical protein [Patescibacteria group bacterium]
MSRRRLGNLLKRKFFLNLKTLTPFRVKNRNEWAEKEIRDFSRLGGSLIVMSMGS